MQHLQYFIARVHLRAHLYGHEVGSAFIGDCLGNQCFAASGGPIQKHTSWSCKAQCGKALRVLDWLSDGKRQLLAHLSTSAPWYEKSSQQGILAKKITEMLKCLLKLPSTALAGMFCCFFVVVVHFNRENVQQYQNKKSSM